MNSFPTAEKLVELRARYPEGTRIELVRMHDDPQPVEPGTRGTVISVDDAGTIHMHWDNGRSLGLVPGVDEFRVIEDLIVRPMELQEELYAFSHCSDVQSRTGMVGVYTAEIDDDGCSVDSFAPFRLDLRTEEFKADAERVITALREKGNILHDRKAMDVYCSSQKLIPFNGKSVGAVVNTEKYSYFIRLEPTAEARRPNVYCFCYVRSWLEAHIRKASAGIRFINSDYQELFRLPDGGKIKIRYAWGETVEKTCRYLDDYHVEIGTTIYHIAEFAERMEQNGHVYEPVKN